MKKLAIAVLFGVWLLLVFNGQLFSQVSDDGHTFYSSDDCFSMDMTWNELDTVLADGHFFVQVRYKNETTGEMIWEEINHPIEAAPVSLGTCGNGLWSYQIRLSNPNAYGGWDAWQVLQMVHVTDFEGVPRPMPPMLAVLENQNEQTE